MNSKIKFEGTINGRVYTDEKVFQYALRDAIAKGEDIEVSATSTAIDEQVETTVECNDDFQIAISPEKIAANLECAEDRVDFLMNLKQGLAAVVDQFNDALAENHINKNKAYEVLCNEIKRIDDMNDKLAKRRTDLQEKAAEIASDLNETETAIGVTTDAISAFCALIEAYNKMLASVAPKPERKDCGCKDRKCEPLTMSELIEGFVNMFR